VGCEQEATRNGWGKVRCQQETSESRMGGRMRRARLRDRAQEASLPSFRPRPATQLASTSPGAVMAFIAVSARGIKGSWSGVAGHDKH
jgi:hypothetical protein